MGSEGQGTAEGRGELRRWKARVPAAATVGAGSNAGPHLFVGAIPPRDKLTQLTQSMDETVHPRPALLIAPMRAKDGRNFMGFAKHRRTMPQIGHCRTALYK
ncbi:hypothetical protein NSE01_07580 [Novosphingobium sediminis]|uniref:Uncharacterized protein n=1 Tax=Novosphingobium sediminis TaxID=707214 RepID=A0A512AGU3_9SPHN|nr:hypothetical protein NSE01_07580 [Novosphingobium sediminis]